MTVTTTAAAASVDDAPHNTEDFARSEVERVENAGDISPVSKLSMDSSNGAASALSELLSGMGKKQCCGTVEEFKALMYNMQGMRRRIVKTILSEEPIDPEWVQLLRKTYEILTDSHTNAFQREMLSASEEKFLLNVKDEIVGLQKDLIFLDHLQAAGDDGTTSTRNHSHQHNQHKIRLSSLNFEQILETHHPVSKEKFHEEYTACVKFLSDFIDSSLKEGRKPIMITDWDGTMKDYCSQYATNLQPIYSAISMARFAEAFTRLTAVLTAGPLRGPGILDLTALPIDDGPIMFSGSWGREWWIGGKRVVHDDGITEEGIDALERLSDEMKTLLESKEYSQFGMVGSGVQRKVDRLTLGIQTVCKHVQPELSTRYQDQVRERVHRVDPAKQMLHFDPSTDLEVEVVVKNNDVVWNKSHGVERVVETVGDSLDPPGRILICGDTSSDVPMVQCAVRSNPQGVMALFVGANESLQSRVRDLVNDESRVCFISAPDVYHAAAMRILQDRCFNSSSTCPPASNDTGDSSAGNNDPSSPTVDGAGGHTTNNSKLDRKNSKVIYVLKKERSNEPQNEEDHADGNDAQETKQ